MEKAAALHVIFRPPEGFVEDIIAAIDYIGTRNFVDREHIGLDRHLRQRRFCRQRSLLRPTHQSRCDYQHV